MTEHDSFAPLELFKDARLRYISTAIEHIAQAIFPRA